MNESFSSDDRRKVEAFIEAGKKQLQMMEDIRESLKDAAKSLAEEFNLKPKVLMVSLRSAYKNDFAAKKEEMDVVEYILNSTGNA